jgi:hypothetical protein
MTMAARWLIGLIIAFGATGAYGLALLYFAPDAALLFGRFAVITCLLSMFAGVALVRGRVVFGRLVPVGAIVAVALMVLFSALGAAQGFAAVPAIAYAALGLLPVVLFGGVVFVRMLIRVW